MVTSREKAVSSVVDAFVAKLKGHPSLMTEITIQSLKNRLNRILETPVGTELYGLGLLPLGPIEHAQSLEEVKEIMDIYLVAVRFYENNHDKLYSVIREEWFTHYMRHGDIHCWDELTSRPILYRRLNRQQSSTYVRDTLSHMK